MVILWLPLGSVVSAIIFICTSAQSDYDVRLIGGHNKYTGQVQIFAEGSWRNICTCNGPDCWTIREATAVCRSLGYNGALSTTAQLDVAFPEVEQVAPFSSFNCRDDMDADAGASDFVRFCRYKEINVTGVCDVNHAPKMVTCNPKALDFEAKPLYQPKKGYIKLKHGSNFYFVCADPPWNQAVTKVFCQSMGLIPSNSVPDLPQAENHEKSDILWAVMSHVTCTSNESNLFECEHQFGLTRCPGNMYATAECLEVVSYTESTGPKNPTTLLPVLPADETSFRYFVFIGCVIAFLFTINVVSLIFAHRKNCQETTPEQQTMTPTYSSVMREDTLIRNATPPPNYSFVIKSHNRRTDTAESLPPPYEDGINQHPMTVMQQSSSVAEYSETSEDVLSFEVHVRPESNSNLETLTTNLPQSVEDQEQSLSQEGHAGSHEGQLEGSLESHCQPLDNQQQTSEGCSHPSSDDCQSPEPSPPDDSQPSADGSSPSMSKEKVTLEV